MTRLTARVVALSKTPARVATRLFLFLRRRREGEEQSVCVRVRERDKTN